MNKPSIFTGMISLASLFAIRKPKGFGALPYPHVKEGQRMLWPSENGTYVRAKHGSLTDESGRPRYV